MHKTAGTAYDERLRVVELLSGVREEIKRRIVYLAVGRLTGVAHAINNVEYLRVGKPTEGLVPQTLDARIRLSEALNGVKQRAMILADVADPKSVNVDNHSTKASPLRTGRLVVRLNREIGWLSEDHDALATPFFGSARPYNSRGAASKYLNRAGHNQPSMSNC